MEMGMLTASLICFLAVIVSGAEEPTDPSSNEEQLTISKLEDADHGPLMKALLAPGENSSSESPELQRDKRHKIGYGQRATFFKKKKGGCYGSCGGGGRVHPQKVLIVVPVAVQYQPKKGGGCSSNRCGGGYQKPVCNTCQSGGGSFSYSSAQAYSSSGSWGGKK